MKNILRLLLMQLIILVISFNVSAQKVDPNAIDGKIYVKFKDDINFNIPSKRERVNFQHIDAFKGLISQYGVTRVTKPFYTASDNKLQKTIAVEFSNYEMVDAFIRELASNSAIEYAEKAPIFKLHYTPNDPAYSTTGNRWHLDKINASTAWNITTGNANIKVAVLDNGIWVNHPDLVNKIVAQIDLGDGDNDPTPPSMTTDWSHGTHTTGLVAAQTNNGVGTAAIGFNVSIMAVKVARDIDSALVAGFEGIVWAADNGARVISMSWGSAQYFQTMQNIVDYAYSKGCVLVASAGNDGTTTLTYPAGLNHVISVGSTDGNSKKSSFSQYGSTIDVMAPGGYQNDGGIIDIILNNCVYSTAYGTGSNAYIKMAGTSMSAPIVAGLCGLMLSVDSTLTPSRLENYLKASCTNINSQNPSYIGQLGAGLINAFAAVKMVQDSISPLVANFKANQTWISEGGMVNFTDLSIGSPTSWQWSFPGGSPATSSLHNPSQILYSTAGTYPVTLTVSDGTLSSTETKTYFITVDASGSSAWLQQTSAFNTQYRGVEKIFIVNPQVVWGGAINGAATTQNDYNTLDFTRTNDGGQTWTPGTITGVPTGYVVSSICATSYNKAWASFFNNVTTSSDKGGIYVTSNGGQSWTNQNTALYNDASSFPNIVYFWDNNKGWAMGDPVGGYFELYNTVDGGANWIRTPSANIPSPISGEYGYTSLYDVKGDTIWFGTNNGRIFISYDKGYNWSVVTVPGITDLQKLTFNNSTNGMLQQISYNTTTGVLETFKVMNTSDGGLNWSSVDTTGMFKSDLGAVPGIPGMFVSVGAAQGASGSSYTVDSGTNWVLLDSGIQYISVKFLDGNTGWAGSFSMNSTMGGIYKWKGLMSVMVSNLPVCAGDTLDVNVNVIGSLNAGNIFTVELSDANGSFAQPTVIGTKVSDVSTTVHCLIPISTLAGTAYRVRAISNNPVNTTNDNGFNLTINNKPLVDAGNNASICYSSSYNLSPVVMYYDSLVWSTSGSGQFNSNTILDPVYTSSLADSAAGFVKLFLTGYSDCGSTVDSLTLTLVNFATAYAGNDVAICQGDSIMLTANGGDTYTWNSTPSLCCLNVPNPIATPLVSTTYTVTIASLCGTASDQVVVTVNPKPVAQISTNDPISFCDGGNATLLADYNASFIYNWLIDGVSTGVNDTLYVSEISGAYNVLVTNNYSCSQLSNTIHINVNSLPTATVSASDTTVFCQGDSIVLTVNTSTTNEYEWYNNGILMSGNGNNPLTVTNSGNYNALITNNASCTSYTSMIGVTVNPTPAKPTITVNGGILFSSSFDGNQWYQEGNLIQGATQRPYTPTVTGNYAVQVTSPEGCLSPMSDSYYITVGINEIDNDLYINVYPNPNNGILYINTALGNVNEMNVELFDALGQSVYTKYFKGGINQKSIDISNFKDGVYFIKLTYDNKEVMGKIMLMK